MRLSELAQEYRSRNGLRANTIVKNCRRFDRFGHPASPEGLAAFRVSALAAGLAPDTIEKTVTDVITVVKDGGKTLDAGKRLRRPAPEPKHEERIQKAALVLPELCDRLAETEGSGRRPDADRTQAKKSGKNFRPWDANCERMAKAYFRKCMAAGQQVPRLAFITEELRKNGSRYPDAKAAATFNQAFKANEERWKPELIEALKDSTQTGRKK